MILKSLGAPLLRSKQSEKIVSYCFVRTRVFNFALPGPGMSLTYYCTRSEVRKISGKSAVKVLLRLMLFDSIGCNVISEWMTTARHSEPIYQVVFRRVPCGPFWNTEIPLIINKERIPLRIRISISYTNIV